MTTRILDVATAEQEARETSDTAERLRRQLVEGDLSIRPADIRKAEAIAEDAALRLAGAQAAKVRADAEDLQAHGDELYDRFREDVTSAFEDVEKRVAQFLAATGGLLDALTTYDDTRQGYKRKWGTLFAGNTDLPAAVQFKAGGTSSGDFGNLGPGQVARHVDPLQLLVALLAEATRGFSGSLGGIDRELKAQLNSGGYANGLQSIRQLRKAINRQETKE